MSTPFVSVIILNHNGRDYLGPCLSSVLNSAYEEFEVILVDNGSVDGSLEYIRRYFPEHKRLKVIPLDRNHGFAQGNNIGYQYADRRTKYLICLNNDTEAEPDWIQEIVRKMEQDPLIGAAQPKIRLMSDRAKIDAVGGIMDYYGRTFSLGNRETDRGQYDAVEEIFYASGAAIALKKEVLEEVGLFDPSYFTYYEDTDLCWRIRLAGYNIVLVSTATVYHWGGATTERKGNGDAIMAAQFRIFHPCKNHLMTMLKNYSCINIIRYALPFSFRILGVALLRVIEGKTTEGFAYIRALWWVLTNSGTTMKKRRQIQKEIRKVRDREVMKTMKPPSDKKRSAAPTGWLPS